MLWSAKLASIGLMAAVVLGSPLAGALGEPLSPAVRIKVNAAGIVGEGGLFLALENGYFAKEGIELEIVPAAAANSGMDTVAQLASGELQLATLAPGAGLFNALARKVGITGIFALNTITRTDKSIGVIVRSDLITSGRYSGLQDLKGLKIAVLTRGGNGHFIVQRAAEKGGLKASDLDLTTMSFPDAIAALSTKAIEAAFEPEPFITIAEERGIAKRVVSGSDASIGTPTIMLYGNAKFINQNREPVTRFVVALLMGQRDYYNAVAKGQNVDELYAVLQKRTQLKDLAMLRKINLPTVDPNGRVDAEAVADLQRFFKEVGSLQRQLELAEYIDQAFLEEALKRIGRVE